MSKTLPALRNAALRYLGRYEASEQSLRLVLRRRLDRWIGEGLLEAEEAESALRAILDEMRRGGLVDDSRFAAAKTRSLARNGKSGKAIRAYLGTRGVDSEIVEEALAGREGEDPEIAAAQRFAQRRGLGRVPERRDRDLAALGRAGFSYAIAIRVICGQD